MINENPHAQEYLSTGEYAEKYGIARSTFWRWLTQGEKALDFFKTKGGNYRIPVNLPT